MENDDESVLGEEHSLEGTSQNELSLEETYVKTESRSDIQGEQYEYKMASLIYLRALLASSKFHLATNMHGTGAFDDIVFKILYHDEIKKEEKCLTIFIQLKHKKKKDAWVSESMLLNVNTRKDDFSLVKYFKSYLTIEEAILNADEENPIMKSDFENCFFVLFTNAAISHKSTTTSQEVDGLICSILNTGYDENGMFMFSDQDTSVWHPDKQLRKKYPGLKIVCDDLDRYHTFLQKFIIFEKQANVIQLDSILKSVISWLCCSSEGTTEKIFSHLNEKFLEWWQYKNIFMTEYSLTWQESVQIQLHDLNTPALFPLQKLFVHFSGEHLQDICARVVWSTELTSVIIRDIDKSIRCFKLYELFKRECPGAFLILRVSNALLKFSEVLSIWKQNLCKMICIDSEDSVENTLILLSKLKAVKVKHHPKLILISGNTSDHFKTMLENIYEHNDQFIDEWCLQQFDDSSQDHILNQKIFFQDNEVILSAFIGAHDNLKTLVCGELLSDLLSKSETLFVNTKRRAKFDFYIPLSVSHSVLVEHAILKDPSTKEVFVLSDISKEELNELLAGIPTPYAQIENDLIQESDFGVLEGSQRYLALDSLIILDSRAPCLSDDDKFMKVVEKNPGKNVHWLKKHSMNFEWLKSEGSSNIISKYAVSPCSDCKFEGSAKCLHDGDFIVDIHSKMILIVGEPGIGKSVLLAHLANVVKKKNSSLWVLNVYLNDICGVLDETDTWTLESLHALLSDEVLCNSSSSCAPLIKQMLRLALLQEGNLIVMLDAFDEISPAFTHSTLLLANLFMNSTKVSKLIVSSRPMLQKELERSLSCYVFVIQPFTTTDQFKFLMSFWRMQQPDSSSDDTESKLEEFAKIVLKLTESIPFTFYGRSFAGIPLHLMMMAEVYSPQKDLFLQTGSFYIISELLNLADLYGSFIGIKRDIYYSKFPVDLKRSKNTGLIEREDTHFIDEHMRCALIVKLSGEELSILHDQTITEKANSFLRKLNLDKTGVIQEVVKGKPSFVHFSYCEYLTALWFAQNYRKNQRAISCMFFQPEFEFVRYIFDELLASDSKLHKSIPCANERMFSVSLASYEPNSRDKGGRTGLHLTASYNNLRFSETMLRWGCDINIEDDVLSWKAVHYGEAVGAWKIVELFLQSGFCPENLSIIKEKLNDEVFIHKNLGDIVRLNCIQLVKVILKRIFIVNKAIFRDVGQEGCTILHIAVKYGHLNIVKYLIEEENADVELSDAMSCTALHYAALRSHLDTVVFLVNAGADVGSRDDQGISALHKAVYVGSIDIVCFLLDSGAGVMTKSHLGITALHLAAEKGHLEIAHHLLAAGAQVNCVTNEGFSPLHSAVLGGNLEMVNLMLNNGANVNVRGKNCATPLLWAVKLGHKSIASLLVEKIINCDVNIRDNIHLAFYLGLNNKILHMLESGVDINQRMPYSGYTPLHAAVCGYNLDVIDLLLDMGAAINSETWKGLTPLHLAVETAVVCPDSLWKASETDVDEKVEETLNVLLDSGAYFLHDYMSDEKKGSPVPGFLIANNVATSLRLPLPPSTEETSVQAVKHSTNQSSEIENNLDSNTVKSKGNAGISGLVPDNVAPLKIPLSLSSEDTLATAVKYNTIKSSEYAFMCKRKLSMIHKLLDKGADLNKMTARGATVIHSAAGRGNCCIMRALFARGYNVNTPSGENGYTPLHCAMFSGRVAAVDFLLDIGANVNHLDYCGVTPLHLAVQEKSRALASVLLQRGADVNIPAIMGRNMTPLHVAAETGDLQMFQLLVDNGADITARTAYTWTPLHIVAGFGYLDITRYLLEKGASANIIDECGLTPLHVAAEGGKGNVIHCLIDCGSDMESKTVGGSTALCIAVQEDKIDAVKALVERGADINCRAKLNATPLHISVAKGLVSITEYLIEKEADVKLCNEEGKNALHMAVICQSGDLLECLLSHKCEVNGKDIQGNTPLHFGAYLNREAMIDILVQNGAAVNIANVEGLAPLGIAFLKSNFNICLMLKNHGSVIACQPRWPKGIRSTMYFPALFVHQAQAWFSVLFLGGNVMKDL